MSRPNLPTYYKSPFPIYIITWAVYALVAFLSYFLILYFSNLSGWMGLQYVGGVSPTKGLTWISQTVA